MAGFKTNPATLKPVWRILKKRRLNLPYDPATPLLGIRQKDSRLQKITAQPCSLLPIHNGKERGNNLNILQGIDKEDVVHRKTPEKQKEKLRVSHHPPSYCKKVQVEMDPAQNSTYYSSHINETSPVWIPNHLTTRMVRLHWYGSLNISTRTKSRDTNAEVGKLQIFTHSPGMNDK